MDYSITLLFKLHPADNSNHRRHTRGDPLAILLDNSNPHIEQSENLGYTKAYSRLNAQLPPVAIRNYPTA
jgi:hypothetical protein